MKSQNTVERGQEPIESRAGARAPAALPKRLRAPWAPRCGRAHFAAPGARRGSASLPPQPGAPGPSRRRGPERESARSLLSDPLSLLLLGEPTAQAAGIAGNCVSKGDEDFGAGRPCTSCRGRGVSAGRTGLQGGGGFPGSPHPSPCRPATRPRKVGVTLTAGEAQGDPHGTAGPGPPVGLGGAHRVARRSAAHGAEGVSVSGFCSTTTLF